jgi:hypothetical protein
MHFVTKCAIFYIFSLIYIIHHGQAKTSAAAGFFELSTL